MSAPTDSKVDAAVPGPSTPPIQPPTPTTPRRAGVLRKMAGNPTTAMAGLGVVIILAVAVLGPVFAPFDPDTGGIDSLLPPSGSHWFGTDEFGRDIFSRMLVGTRVSVFIGVSAVLIGGVLGTLLGVVAGVRGGLLDATVMRLMDVLLAFPVLVLATVISGVTTGRQLALGPLHLSQEMVLSLVVAVIMVPIFARLGRASVLGEMNEEYIVAARACGVPFHRIVRSHLLPNIQAPLVVQGAFDIGSAILIEASLSFLGVGIQMPQSSWGNVLAAGQQQILLGGWWLVVFPTAAIMMSALCFNLLGDGLRDALDPKHAAAVRRRRLLLPLPIGKVTS